jgi:hypothetical protein
MNNDLPGLSEQELMEYAMMLSMEESSKTKINPEVEIQEDVYYGEYDEEPDLPHEYDYERH